MDTLLREIVAPQFAPVTINVWVEYADLITVADSLRARNAPAGMQAVSLAA